MAKLAKKKTSNRITGADTVATFMEYIVATVCCAIFVLVPLYMKNGFYGIGDSKYNTYKGIVFVALPILSVLGILYLFLIRKQINKEWLKLNLSILDRVMILYLICVCVSFAVCDFKSEAVMGYPGWNMGLISQFTFVLLYFFVSRFGKDAKGLLILLCGVSAIVFLLGVCNRFLIDPLGVYEGIDPVYRLQFLSTLGQSSWYSSFVCTTLPLGGWFFWSAEGTRNKVLSGIYCVIGFSTLVTQNSDSAYIALLCFMFGIFCFSVSSMGKLMSFFRLTLLFLTATRLMYVCTFIFNSEIIGKLDALSRFLIMNRIMWLLFVINILLLLLLKVINAKGINILPIAKIVRNLLWVVIIGGIVLCIIILYLSGTGRLPENIAGITNKIPYLTWNDEWGNKRGFSWRVTWQMFVEMNPINKVFGVGPESYPYYAYSKYKDVLDTMFKGNVLSNAHNEWYNAMINYGIVGTVSYLGIFIMAIKHFVKNRENNPWLIGILLCVASYVGHNFFCYQQVLCTPFVFIMMGFGERFIRNMKYGRK